LSARLDQSEGDEISAMEAALNQTAEQLGQSFAEIESRRQELAAMLDSMQEAGGCDYAGRLRALVECGDAADCGNADSPGRTLVHSVRDPDVLACIRGALENHEVRFGARALWRRGAFLKSTRRRCPQAGRWLCCTM